MLPGVKIMADGKQDDRNAVRTKKIEVGYRQTLRRKKEYTNKYIDGLLWSQNLLTYDVGTHCEATDGTVNISNDLPPSPTSVTPALRIELIGDENVLAAEVVNSETTSSKSVNTDEHLHLPLASVGTTSMSNEFNGHPNFLKGDSQASGASGYTTDYQHFMNNENLDWEEPLEEDDSYHKSVRESSIPDDYVNDWLVNLNDENIDVSHEEAVRRSLAEWVLDCNIPRAHVSNLLKRLNREAGLAYLPLDSRTLLKSLKSRIQCRVVEPGSYFNFGIASTLAVVLALLNSKDIPNVLQFIWNIDGLPLVKSSGNSFWPIVGKLYNVEYAELIVVAVFCGIKKPNCINDFFCHLFVLARLLNDH
uniref:Transposase domain-containing protein n=1 Tax=Daphnia magna TaxID=35525 RepID=A0A0P5ZSP4_9CRUS